MTDRVPGTVHRTGTAVLGLGPAGTGLLTAAAREGVLASLAERGLCLVDTAPTRRVAAGSLGDYRVRSDTDGRVFNECAAALRPVDAAADAAAGVEPDGPVELGRAAELLRSAGHAFLESLTSRFGADLWQGRVVALDLDGRPRRVLVRSASSWRVLEADRIVVATGGRPHLPSWAGRDTVHSDLLLRGRSGLECRKGRARPVVVVGGSHSAFSCVRYLLDHGWGEPGDAGTIRVLHRSPIRVTYPDVEAARRDGASFDELDVCPQTGRVFRFGGLRGDAAELWTRVRRREEPRVTVQQVSPRQLRRAVADAALVIAATGYAPAIPELLGARAGGSPPRARWRFDSRGRLRDEQRRVVPGILGIGLGAGRTRDVTAGGEPSFQGKVDGVWFYQNVGSRHLLDQLAAAA